MGTIVGMVGILFLTLMLVAAVALTIVLATASRPRSMVLRRRLAAALVLAVAAAGVIGWLAAPARFDVNFPNGDGFSKTPSVASQIGIFALVSLLALVPLLAVVTASVAGQPRLKTAARFASRQSLVLTGVNVSLVARGLTVQWRWRRLGLVAALAVGLFATAWQGSATLSLGAALSGWFLGAMYAEFRIHAPDPDGIRRASLVRRRAGQYVSSVVIRTVAVTLGVISAVTLSATGWGMSKGDLTLLWDLVLLIALFAGLVVVARRVVGRRAPTEPADTVDADAALRCQSLTVLSGCAVALAALAGARPLAYLLASTGLDNELVDQLAVLAMIGTVGLGWWVAVFARSVRWDRHARSEAAQESVHP